MSNSSGLFVCLAGVLVIGCTPAETPVEKAERRYATVEKTGSDEEKCREGRRLVEAYLDAGHPNYEFRRNMVELGCTLSAIERQKGY